MISIVMTYYNRPSQLYFTLESIRMQQVKDVEIIIVDDGSDDKDAALLVVGQFCDLHTKVISIPKSDKWWINPCIPYNKGFKEAAGDIIIIQNAECLHFGNLIKYAKNTINEGKYLSFSCYSATQQQCKKFENLKKHSNMNLLECVKEAITPLNRKQWYNHPSYRPVGYHFTSVIMKKDLEVIKGFNEEFAVGYCFEDNEFLFRLEKNGIPIQIVPIEHGFAVHQWHTKSTTIIGRCPEWYRNKSLYEKITGKEYIEI